MALRDETLDPRTGLYRKNREQVELEIRRAYKHYSEEQIQAMIAEQMGDNSKVPAIKSLWNEADRR